MKKNLLILLTLLCFNHSKGQAVFSKVYYDASLDIYGYSIVPSPDNGFLICGNKFNEGLIYKIDSAGTIVWAKKYAIGSVTKFSLIAAAGDSNYVVVGNAATATTERLVCMKITASGDTLWTSRIGGANLTSATSVQQTSDGGFILSGLTTASSPPYYESMVVKLDSSGGLEWNSLVTTGTHSNYIYSVKETPDSGYVAIGTSDSLNHYRLMLFRLNSGGTFLWGRKYVSTSPFDLQGADISVLPDGFICLGGKGLDYMLMRTDTSGNVLWGQSYWVTSFGQCLSCNPSRLKTTSGGGYVFVNGNDPFSGSQSSMACVDSVGNVKWFQSVLMSPTDITETSDSGFAVVGLGPLYGVRGMSTSTNPQVGVLRTDSMGNGTCTFSFTLFTNSESMVFYPLSYTTSSPGTVSNVQPVITTDILVTDTGCVAFFGGFEEVIPDNFISIYPNPATSLTQIYFAKPARQYDLSVTNVLGQEVFSRILTGEETRKFSMDVDFPAGMYVVSIRNDKSNYSKRLLIRD